MNEEAQKDWWAISYMSPLVNGARRTTTLWAPTAEYVTDMVQVAIRDGAKEITLAKGAGWKLDNEQPCVVPPHEKAKD